ncbi:MAG TPA: class I SAM-dependent methyltransferase, partial [Candidatus Sulfotelmatobacter sp.]|nr:class I SAM-dependent methyltransferase [Candidatus Sulfotelmatobacter sp.]
AQQIGAATQPNPLEIFTTIKGFQRAFALKAAVDLGLFTAIARGSHTPAEIGKACSAAERGIRILADAMVVMGFLRKDENSYHLTQDSAVFLDSRSPAYLGGAVKFLMHPIQMGNFETLSQAVRQGGCAMGEGSLAPEDPIWVDFARGMTPLMMPAAQAIAQLLQPTLSARPSPKVLDIAAGHGVFGVTVAQAVPSVQIYALDWANVLQVAQELAKRVGVADRYHLLPGSAFDVDYGSGYDAVLLTNFLHHFPPADNEALLKKVHTALNPGGQVIILEFVPNEDRVSPPLPALFSLTMLSSTPQGDAYTFAELEKMCQRAGFEGMKQVPLEPLPETLVTGRKAS